MSQRLNNLNEIISVLKSGAEFYRKAARKTGTDELEKICCEHADLRDQVAVELSDVVEEAGHEPASASAKEKGHAGLASVAAVFNDTDTSLTKGLEEHEDRTQAVLRNAIHHKDNERDKPMLESYMSAFQQAHERVRSVLRDL